MSYLKVSGLSRSCLELSGSYLRVIWTYLGAAWSCLKLSGGYLDVSRSCLEQSRGYLGVSGLSGSRLELSGAV